LQPGIDARMRRTSRASISTPRGTIYAGSNEIQRNIIARMLLGL
jgi:alkylation response protein AidB-like acyl-CoA dehydrogenase